MKSGPYCVTEDELQAYTDGVLDPDRKAAIESYLGAIPAEEKRIESYRRVNVELHRSYDRPELASTPPCYAFLANQLSRAMRRQRRIRRLARGAASLIVAIGALWSGYNLYPGRAQMIAVATHPATDARSATLTDLDRASAKLASEKFLAAAKPDLIRGLSLTQVSGLRRQATGLARLGFELSAANVVSTKDGPAVELSYQSKADHPMTLSIKPSGTVHKTALTILEDKDASVVSWQTGGFTYSLVGDIGHRRLLELARAVSDSPQLPGLENGMMRTAQESSARATPPTAPPVPQANPSDGTATSPHASVSVDGAPATDAQLSGASASPNGSSGAGVQKIGLRTPN